MNHRLSFMILQLTSGSLLSFIISLKSVSHNNNNNNYYHYYYNYFAPRENKKVEVAVLSLYSDTHTHTHTHHRVEGATCESYSLPAVLMTHKQMKSILNSFVSSLLILPLENNVFFIHLNKKKFQLNTEKNEKI